jgi:beta-glucosidase-like glycosyl hydrolase/CubicO group peptidase (beta-lactamase class C family)
MKKYWWLLLIFMCRSFYSVGVTNHIEVLGDVNANKSGLVKNLSESSWIDSVSASLNLDQKIAQFFMLGAYPTQGETNRADVEKIIKDYNIGGIIFFKGHPTQIASWSNSFQSAAKTPLFVSIDGEWGINMRADSTIQYPRQLTLGAIQNNDLILNMGERIGNECKAIGININLAPVIDINNNVNNPVINDRSFGEDKYNVALKGLAYAQGMQNVGVMAVGKHFPGHGDTDTDSHKTLPVIPHTFERLDSLELFPFKVAIENGMMGMMVAHLSIPSLDNTPNLASSLSKKVVTHLLKDSLGFDGLVFSDALNMKGVSKYFAPGEVDKIAFLAGNDVLVVSEDIPRGIALIKQAVNDGEISEAYIDMRLRKVLAYKYAIGLNKNTSVNTKNLPKYLNNDEGQKINQALFEAAITIASNDNHILPLSLQGNMNIASLVIGSLSKQKFQEQLEYYGVSKHFNTESIASSEVSTQLDKLAAYETVIVGVQEMSRWKSKNYGFSAAELDLLKKLNTKTKVILVLFGTPYSLVHFDDFKSIVVAYEENNFSEVAAAKAIFGAIKVNGTLPISAGCFKSNTGVLIDLEEGNMQYANPNDMGLDGKRLDSIDFYANKAIKLKATPGCQILVAKDGKIVYDKSFGFATYNSNVDINANTIYDLASITKVAATTMSIMKLYENGQVDLDEKLQTYLPDLKGTTVGGLVIKDLLAHQSGLPAWIPFYLPTIEDSVYNNWYSVDSNAAFCVRVAKDLFICKDSTQVIWQTIEGITIKEKPKYKYSDLGFYLLMKVVEAKSGKTLDKFVDYEFYYPMGLKNISFLPLNKYALERIPPTESDTIFRKQEVKGYVHDPGAAMLGGVAGHAGLFSNAKDLAAVFQMLMDGGTYDGKRYLKEETVLYFNTLHFENRDNRRGLGFDKPTILNEKTGERSAGPTYEKVSPLCFGHTGFTGTCVWADPKEKLVYVFLSNRTFPSATVNILANENIRTDIQAVIYRSLIK